MIREQARPTFSVFIILTLITGIFYPFLVTSVAQTFFRDKANGSLIYQNGQAVGSELIGQTFNDSKYLWGRPSATAPTFNGAASSGSNLGPSNPSLLESIRVRIKILKEADPGNTQLVPVDLVTASASGLDPHISPAAAYYQAPRIARIRGIAESEVNGFIKKHTEGRFFGLLGEPVVNVLKVNLALDAHGK